VYVTENAGWSAQESIVTAAVSTVFCVVLLRTLASMLFREPLGATSTAAAPAVAARTVTARSAAITAAAVTAATVSTAAGTPGTRGGLHT
jgi:hypothetical protein